MWVGGSGCGVVGPVVGCGVVVGGGSLPIVAGGDRPKPLLTRRVPHLKLYAYTERSNAV